MPSSPSMIPEQITAIEDAPPRQIEEMTRAFVKLFTSVGSLVWEWAWCELIEQAGWLPHASIPPELIADAKDVEDAGLRLEKFFRENWPQVSEDLRRSVHASDADAEAREAFNECIRAHSLGLDRKSVVSGKRVSVSVDPGGRRIIKKKKNDNTPIP